MNQPYDVLVVNATTVYTIALFYSHVLHIFASEQCRLTLRQTPRIVVE